MEHNGNISARASTDERACHSPRAAQELGECPPDDPQFATRAEADAWWAGVTHGLRCASGEYPREDHGPVAPADACGESAEVFDPSGRRLRVDGWLPWKKARFLLVLVAGGIVADACRAVGMSVASAYALKNRRSGRAFGKMWDAILIHRARGRLADNNLERAMNGCVEQVLKDGVVVAERRRFDNRLSMAMLARLDRLAESMSGEESDLLRALSEDFDDYLDVVEAGGDEDAFLQAHRRQPKGEAASDAPVAWYTKDFVDEIAALGDASEWRDHAPAEIPIVDLDPDRMGDWDLDRWIRAVRSDYLSWLEQYRGSGESRPRGRDCPAAFQRIRREFTARMAAGGTDAEARFKSSPGFLGEGDHAKHGGGVTGEVGEGSSENHRAVATPTPPPACGWSPSPSLRDGEDKEPWQASTSSTSPAAPSATDGSES